MSRATLEKAKALWGVEHITAADEKRLSAFLREFREAIGRALLEHPELAATQEFKNVERFL